MIFEGAEGKKVPSYMYTRYAYLPCAWEHNKSCYYLNYLTKVVMIHYAYKYK